MNVVLEQKKNWDIIRSLLGFFIGKIGRESVYLVVFQQKNKNN